MTTDLPPFPAPRIVKPRKPASTWRPVIAITATSLLIERSGAIHPADELPAVIASEPSSILACQGFGQHLERLRRVFRDNPRYQDRLTPHYRDSRPGNGEPPRATRIYDATVNFVGFKDPAGKHSVYHYPLDPVYFVRKSIDEIDPDDSQDRLGKLLVWATRVRDWCHEQEIQVKPSSGGLVTQLLKDPRFYPEARRKVPRRINDAARSQLPGNYYRLHAEVERSYRAIYLDQSGAHHFAARTIRFPDANTLFAYGHTGDNAGRRIFDGPTSALLNHPGIYRLRLSVPAIRHSLFPPPFLDSSGTVDAWVYSNEFELIADCGASVLGVLGAIISPDRDRGLNLYSEWATEQLRHHPTDKPWLKPTLHSTYGVLAARPQPFETGYFRAKGGTPRDYPMGNVSIPVVAHTTTRPVESRLANVIHRGMIEAEVRKQSLWFARFLTEVDRRDVLSVYADSVFIRDNGAPVKLLPPPWRVADHVEHLRFYSATHFASDTLTRLPGLSRDRGDDARLDRLMRRELITRQPLLHGQATVLRSPHKPHTPQGGDHATAQGKAERRAGVGRHGRARVSDG